MISAEIPDPHLDPEGHAAVVKFMIHGPCGIDNPNAPCMKDGKCSKHFPKEFCSETAFDKFENVVYRRRDSGIQVQKGKTMVDNRYVVPYNRNLLVRAQAHINVEVCHKGGLVKYLFKYITKGSDRSLIIAEDSTTSAQVPSTNPKKTKDEIQEFIDCRSLFSYEAVWRINEYPIHHREPNVVRLAVHLPGQQNVSYRRQSNVRNVLKNPKARKTHLTTWFELNIHDPDARKLTYAQIPGSYTWNEEYNEWTPRKRGFAIGRIAYVPPGSSDVFFLRLLLTKVHGAMSFLALRTVRGEICSTYEKACEKLGLLSDSSEWIKVLQEISASSMPHVIRTTFVSMLMFCEVPNPCALFESSWKLMSEDHAYSLRKQLHSTTFQPTDERLQNWVLHELESLLGSHGSSLEQFHLPRPTDSEPDDGSNPLINQHLDFDVDNEKQLADTMLHSLNVQQFEAFSAVMLSINNNLGKSYFLYGHGETGKTFLYNAIIAKLKSLSKIAIIVASSGIAATLLPNGTTAHSRFKIPLHVYNISTCSIKKGTHLAELIREASLIVWDEAPMTHRHAFEAISRTFCDLMNVPLVGVGHKLFGGKTVIFGGDFRQTLPVITESGREQTVDGSIPRSVLWPAFTVLKLERNMRLNESLENRMMIGSGQNFEQWILAIGDGKLPTKCLVPNAPSDWIEIPRMFLIAPGNNPVQSITTDIYNSFEENYKDTKYLKSRAIVTPTNIVVTEINDFMLQKLSRPSHSYFSADSMQLDTEVPESFSETYPPEFLNTLTFNGVPDHEIRLKVHASIMLLRNLSPPSGLCNGTRIMITSLGENTIIGHIMGGSFDTKPVAIPRIVLNIEDKRWPFVLKR
ncbi:unnamed protein product [Linum trigynum]|uniref:ATP-dependent DNA helicase n=1 Tax=Linum trigynum TaxID=586398 RepID=A0AAV2FVU9_9ROSI